MLLNSQHCALKTKGEANSLTRQPLTQTVVFDGKIEFCQRVTLLRTAASNQTNREQKRRVTLHISTVGQIHYTSQNVYLATVSLQNVFHDK